MLLVGFFLIFGNIAVVFHPGKYGLKDVKGLRDYLPPEGKRFIHDAFLMTGMFSSYSTNNLDLVIRGHLSDADWLPEDDRWIDLPIKDHLPRTLGTEYTRLWGSHHKSTFGKKAQKQARKVFADKMRARHILLHPDQPIDGIMFGVESWRQDPSGYRAGKTPETTKFYTWHEDDIAPDGE